MSKIVAIKPFEPKLTSKQVSKQLGFSDSTIKRFRDDRQTDSLFNRNKNKKERTKQDTSVANSTSTNETSKSVTNKILKGGSFQDAYETASSYIDHEKSNYITLARKVAVNIS